MGDLSKRFKKEEVFYFTREVKKLLELLNGTTISCTDKEKIFTIENQIDKLENLVYKYEPTIYDEYSMKTEYAYKKMIRARKEYDRVVEEKCYKETIGEYRLAYEKSANEYKKLKEYRNKLKLALIEE
ncbi:MAG: hypothetical protein KH415_11210 [Clostridium sp.]|nr:hypothetical protein [Clostridium sp.]